MRVQLVVGVLLVVTLAGCLGGDGDVEAPEDNGDPLFSEETGSLAGQIMNRDLNPVPSAEVTLIQDGEAKFSDVSRADGRYAVNFVTPGLYQVQVSTTGCCYAQVVAIEIAAGEPATRNFLLEIISEDDLRFPFVSGPESWTGLFECAVAGVNLCQNNKFRHSVDVERGVKTITAGLVWDNSAGGDELILEVRHEPAILAEVQGSSPLQVTINNDDIADGDVQFDKFEDEGWLVEFRVASPLLDGGVLYQQPFTVWWTFHYWQEAPPGYSTLPDA